ncbi:hypothetical protein AAMO2058_001478300 [Amorphochlora amoebiformis]
MLRRFEELRVSRMFLDKCDHDVGQIGNHIPKLQRRKRSAPSKPGLKAEEKGSPQGAGAARGDSIFAEGDIATSRRRHGEYERQFVALAHNPQ